MGHDPKKLQAVMEAASPPDLELGFRPMFGGIMGYAAGQAFASLSNVGLALKMTGANHAALSAVPDVKPLRYEPGDPPSKSYLLLPDAMLSDPDSLRLWIARSAAGLKPTTRKPRKKPVERKKGVGAVLATVVLAVVCSAAPAPSQATDRNAALTSLVDSFTRAQREHNQPRLAALTTPDYVEVSPIGDVDTRDEMLGLYAPDKKRASPELVISERLTRRQGDTALVLAKLSFAAPGPGGVARTVAMRASFVARRTGRIWRLAATHYTPVRPRQEAAQEAYGGQIMSRISFVELPVSDLASARSFYSNAFGLAFTDFGPSYSSMMTGDVDIGLQADASEATSAPLAVITVDDLEASFEAVGKAGGVITKPIFAFPGGRRFHFRDPSGNELAALKAD